MATTTNPQPEREAARLMAFRTSSAVDRVKSFARARRHTRTVRILRWLFPISAAGLVAVYMTAVMETVGWVDGLPQVEIAQIIPENLTMHNPRYEGFNKDGGTYVVAAKTAVQDLTDLSRITLNDITGDLTDADKRKTNLKAAHGLYNSKKNELELYDGIEIASESGLRARLSRATVLTKDNIVFSKEPVTVAFPAGTIDAREMTLNNKSRTVTFLNDVKAHLVPKEGEEKSAATSARSATGAPILSAADGPIVVRSSQLDIDDVGKTATFSGNVRAVQGGATLETAALKVGYSGQMAGGSQSTSDAGTAGTKINRIASDGPVVLTRGTNERVTAQSLDFDAVKQVTLLQGDVVMTSGNDRRVTSNTASIDQKADTIVLTGNVAALQGRNALGGERLYIDQKTGRTRLTSPGKAAGNSPGRIKTRFYRDGPTAAPTIVRSAQGAASTSSAGVFRTNPNAPVDVGADRLDVDDRKKQAVYKGSVRAKQGDFEVLTSTLRAYYTGQAGLADQTQSATKKKPADLTRIQAQGGVIVSSKEGQKATADWADYDVKANKMTLGGDEVVLTQGKNIVRGTQLIIDMTTGQSMMQNNPSAGWSAKAAPAGAKEGTSIVIHGPKGGRPSAIFYPSKKKSAPKTIQDTARDIVP